MSGTSGWLYMQPALPMAAARVAVMVAVVMVVVETVAVEKAMVVVETAAVEKAMGVAARAEASRWRLCTWCFGGCFQIL